MKKLCIALILSAIISYVPRAVAACDAFANTPGVTAWTIADQIRAIAEGADATGNDVFAIRQADLPITIGAVAGSRYIVTEDLFMSGTSDAITIVGPVTLDFQGHTLVQLPSTSATRAAVRVNSPVSEIKNGSIILNNGANVPGATSVIGIDLASTYERVSDMRIVGGLGTAGALIGDCINVQGFKTLIKDCVLSQASRGIVTDAVGSSLFEQVYVNNMSSHGFAINDASVNIFIVSSQAFNCGGSGFFIDTDVSTMYLENCVSINCLNGFRMTATSDSMILQSCVSIGASNIGFSSSTAVPSHYIHNCAAIGSGVTDYNGWAASTGYSFPASMAVTDTTVNWWSSLASN